MSTRPGFPVLVLMLTGLISLPALTQAAPWEGSPSAELPFTARFHPPNSIGFAPFVSDREVPFSLGVKFTAWWNDLNDPSSLDFRSDNDAARAFPRFRPHAPQKLTTAPADFRSSLLSVNLFARRPFGISSTFPEGRWSPYVGVGTGADLSPIKVTLMTETETSLTPALQVVAGMQLFVTRTLAVFSEYRFSPTDHQFMLLSEKDRPTSRVDRFIGGFSLHF